MKISNENIQKTEFYLIAGAGFRNFVPQWLPDLLKNVSDFPVFIVSWYFNSRSFQKPFSKICKFLTPGVELENDSFIELKWATGCLTLLAGGVYERGVGGRESIRNYPLSSTDVLFHTPRVYSHFEIFNASSVAKSPVNRLRFMGQKRKSVCVYRLIDEVEFCHLWE